MSVAIIIPSRYGSTRLPGKALAEIDGKPLFLWVYDACKKVENAACVIIATDHKLIFDAANVANAEVLMTSTDHKSGTDRCAEIAESLNVDYIINVQGDEPFIDPMELERVIDHLKANPEINILTLFHKLNDPQAVDDPSKVKLTKTANNKILYFSRSVIPYEREQVGQSYYKHVGIYAFRKDSLLQVSQLPESKLEKTEGLEQLRWLENGYEIFGLEVNSTPIGVDTKEDLAKARTYAKNRY